MKEKESSKKWNKNSKSQKNSLPQRMTNYHSKGKINRRKGHNAERYYADKFRSLGYPKCITSRQGSRIHDDSGIDLIFIPYNVQIKAGKQRGLNPIQVLKNMEIKMKENFPEDNQVFNQPNIVILRKEVGQGTKRTKYDDVVILAFEDFEKIIKPKKIR